MNHHDEVKTHEATIFCSILPQTFVRAWLMDFWMKRFCFIPFGRKCFLKSIEKPCQTGLKSSYDIARIELSLVPLIHVLKSFFSWVSRVFKICWLLIWNLYYMSYPTTKKFETFRISTKNYFSSPRIHFIVCLTLEKKSQINFVPKKFNYIYDRIYHLTKLVFFCFSAYQLDFELKLKWGSSGHGSRENTLQISGHCNFSFIWVPLGLI